MPLIEALLPEFDREMGQTRKVLDRVPDGQFDWRPHPTSVALGRLAEHLAEMPLWATTTMAQGGIDMMTLRPAEYKSPTNRTEVLAMFDANLKAARPQVANKTDSEFDAPWTLKAGGKQVFTMPKASVMRSFVINHMVHHRGQMTVYLRMLGVKIPSIYGPSGDEQM